MRVFRVSLSAVLLVLLSACAGVGVVSTSDPAQKLLDAYYLLEHEDRPLIAERLIREALDIYARNKDELGIAEAYKYYGIFFSSASLSGKWSTYYQSNGFLDKSVAYDKRYAKSLEYLQKAGTVFSAREHYDKLANVNFNAAFANLGAGDRKEACAAFDRSGESHRMNIERNPTSKPIVPKGYSSFPEFLEATKARYGCSV
jgi:tetratricopeptide (TPR) repeat protein